MDTMVQRKKLSGFIQDCLFILSLTFTIDSEFILTKAFDIKDFCLTLNLGITSKKWLFSDKGVC